MVQPLTFGGSLTFWASWKQFCSHLHNVTTQHNTMWNWAGKRLNMAPITVWRSNDIVLRRLWSNRFNLLLESAVQWGVGGGVWCYDLSVPNFLITTRTVTPFSLLFGFLHLHDTKTQTTWFSTTSLNFLSPQTSLCPRSPPPRSPPLHSSSPLLSPLPSSPLLSSPLLSSPLLSSPLLSSPLLSPPLLSSSPPPHPLSPPLPSSLPSDSLRTSPLCVFMWPRSHLSAQICAPAPGFSCIFHRICPCVSELCVTLGCQQLAAGFLSCSPCLSQPICGECVSGLHGKFLWVPTCQLLSVNCCRVCARLFGLTLTLPPAA